MSSDNVKDGPPSGGLELQEKEKNGVKTPDEDAQVTYQFTRFQIIKNLIVVSFGFLFLFTAYQSMVNVQTSLNMKNETGSGSLSILYGALIVSCMFIPPFVIAHLGYKWTIPVSMSGYILFMVANFYPKWGTMATGAILLGIGAAPLWTAQCTYLTQTGVWYAKMTGQTEDAVINAFFGVFFMIFQSSQIWGNLIVAKVLQSPNNETDQSPEALALCGANFCPKSDAVTNATNLNRPVETRVYILYGIYTGCACTAALIIIVLLDRINLSNEDNITSRKFTPKFFIETFRHLYNSRYQKLLVPLTIYSGIEQAFIGGDFTRSFVTCSLGVWNVGYIMICYGVVDATCSLLFGRIVVYIGHIPFFILAFVVHLGCQITLLLWMPDPGQVYIYYIIAGFWGMGDAVIQTQINAFYGYLFADNSVPAFSNYRLWESIGFVVTYAYNDHLCTSVKTYVCIGVLCVGMLGYGITEILVRRKVSPPEEKSKEF